MNDIRLFSRQSVSARQERDTFIGVFLREKKKTKKTESITRKEQDGTL